MGAAPLTARAAVSACVPQKLPAWATLGLPALHVWQLALKEHSWSVCPSKGQPHCLSVLLSAPVYNHVG